MNFYLAASMIYDRGKNCTEELQIHIENKKTESARRRGVLSKDSKFHPDLQIKFYGNPRRIYQEGE
jgi:hypothetical protein